METLNLVQGDEAWFEARLGIPTTSEFSKILTPKTGNLSAQAEGYMAELIVEQVEGVGDKVSTYWMERGRLLEGEARNWYEFETSQDVEQTGLILNKGAGWSPDGIPDKKTGLEIKCPAPKTHVKYLMTGGMPAEHKPQVHGQIVVGELDWIDFVSYCPGYKPLLVRVTPDKYTLKVAAALEEFLQRYAEVKKKLL